MIGHIGAQYKQVPMCRCIKFWNPSIATNLWDLVETDQLGSRETYGVGTDQQPTMPSAALITG